jgi:hypothetical protein
VALVAGAEFAQQQTLGGNGEPAIHSVILASTAAGEQAKRFFRGGSVSDWISFRLAGNTEPMKRKRAEQVRVT